jgi:small GTP-binding protein
MSDSSAVCHTFKVILIGDSGVGKTSLFQQYMYNRFDVHKTVSCGVDRSVRPLMIGATLYQVVLLDTPGQPRYRDVVKPFFRSADGVLLVYAVNMEESFQSLPDWIQRLTDSNRADVPVVVVGNKCDLLMDVPFETGEAFARERGIPIMLTSCVTGEGIADVFAQIFQLVVTDHERRGIPWNTASVEVQNIEGDVVKKSMRPKCRC